MELIRILSILVVVFIAGLLVGKDEWGGASLNPLSKSRLGLMSNTIYRVLSHHYDVERNDCCVVCPMNDPTASSARYYCFKKNTISSVVLTRSEYFVLREMDNTPLPLEFTSNPCLVQGFHPYRKKITGEPDLPKTFGESN